MAAKNNDWHSHRGKPLVIAGIVLFLMGILRFYNVDWPVVLMVIGTVLFAKGMIIKSMKEKRI
ncbi:MAG: hypothetical protein HYS80_00015 [Candidatus Aenigmarchaeota archaeon]|nr:hypothetical protein [Candidatus Aenigmarchaeota archaeon]